MPTRKLRISWQEILTFVGGAGITIYGIVIQQHTAAVYAVLFVYLAILLVAEYMKARAKVSRDYLAHPRSRKIPGPAPTAGGRAEHALEQILDMLARSVLATAAFRYWQGQSYDHPVTLKAIREAWDRAGLAAVEAPEAVTQHEPQNAIAVVQRSIGAIAILLPVGLLIAIQITHYQLPSSLSAFYYTPMRTLFEFGFCGLGLLLILYKDDSIAIRLLTTVAGAGFIGAGIFPVLPRPSPLTGESARSVILANVHLFCLVSAFLALAWVAALFTQPQHGEDAGEKEAEREEVSARSLDSAASGRRKRQNILYRSCACCVLACTLAAVPAAFFEITRIISLFWFESLAMFAIGLSWLVRGGAVRM